MKGQNGDGGGWQGASGGAVRDKPVLVYGLARHRRISSSARPSRGQAAYTPEEAEWRKREATLRWKLAEIEEPSTPYQQRFGDKAAAAIESTLDAREREALARAVRNRPAGVDGLGLVDYLYLAQLPALLFKPDVWQGARASFGGDADAKRRLQVAIDQITPVRNEIAHVREVSPEKLQRANLACADVLAMLTPA